MRKMFSISTSGLLMSALVILGVAYHNLTVKIQIGDLLYSSTMLEISIWFIILFFLWRLLVRLSRKILYAFDWYNRHHESNMPNRLINLVINYKLGIENKSKLPEASLPKQQQIYVELIRFLTEGDFDSRYLLPYFSGSCLLLIRNSLSAIQNEDYIDAIKLLESLMKRYKITPWIYTNLRTCYVETGNFQALDLLNHKAGDRYQAYFGPDGKNEAKIMMLQYDYGTTTNLKKKLSLLANIHAMCSDNEKYLVKYVEHLQNVGEFDLAVKIIERAWPKVSSIRIATLLLEILGSKSSHEIYDFTLTMPHQDLLATKFLVAKAAIKANMLSVSENKAVEIMQLSPVLGHILLLEAAKLNGDMRTMRDIIDSLTQIRPELLIHNVVNNIDT